MEYQEEHEEEVEEVVRRISPIKIRMLPENKTTSKKRSEKKRQYETAFGVRDLNVADSKIKNKRNKNNKKKKK